MYSYLDGIGERDRGASDGSASRPSFQFEEGQPV